MAMQQHNARQYDEEWADLNRQLQQQAARLGLGTALETLHRQQLTQGFVRDDLGALQRYIFPNPTDTQRHFAVQFNPARTRRFAGAGVMTPPPGMQRVHDGCFLCLENVRWQQQGIEIGFDIQVEGRSYIAWMNPYPLQPGHTVIASQEHSPQAWRSNGEPGAGRGLPILIEDLVTLAVRLPGWIGFYNGAGAGASIPHHFHYQFLRRPTGSGPLPLEVAATCRCEGVDGGGYPLGFAHWRGEVDTVVPTATRWIRNWIKTPHPKVARLTANIIATADNHGVVDLYFVPRDQANARSPRMSGLIGGLETLGELVFSTDEEKRQLDNGEIDYQAIANILAGVSVPI